MNGSIISGLFASFVALAISFGAYLNYLPNIEGQEAQVISSQTQNITSGGTPIAFVTTPEGLGSYDLGVLKDGVKPPLNSEDVLLQYDTYTIDPKSQDWFGYSFSSTQTFEKIVFQEGITFPDDGGWFSGTPQVEVRQNGLWIRVSSLSITPSYPGVYNETSFQTYTLQFSPTSGDAIRIIGVPGGLATFTSVAELEVYGYSGSNNSNLQTNTGNTEPQQSQQMEGNNGGTDAVVSDWSNWYGVTEWSACANGMQTRTEERTRQVIQSASNGGSTPSLSDTQTVSTSCGGTTSSETSQVSTVKFAKGDVIQTLAAVKVRGSGSINGSLLGTQRALVTGKILEGPISNGGIQWWRVDYTTSVDGWSAEDYLTKFSGMISVTQQSSQVQPTAAPLPRKITQDLKIGSSGAEVRVLQNYLIRKAYLGKGLNGGYYGYSTSNAVKSYQHARGIKPTGTVGPQTRTKINSEL